MSNSTSKKILKCATCVPEFIEAARKLAGQPNAKLAYWNRAGYPTQEYDEVHIYIKAEKGAEDPSKPFISAIQVEAYKGSALDIFTRYKDYPYALGDGITTYQDFCDLLTGFSKNGQLADEYTVLLLTDIVVGKLKYDYKRNAMPNQGYVYDEI